MALSDEIVELLPQGLDSWDKAKVETLIQEGLSKARILSNAWNIKVSLTSEFVDISESGSNRAISSVYKNSFEVAKYWSELAAKEEEKAQTGGVSRSRTHRAVRV